jgi:hypothetical protein
MFIWLKQLKKKNNNKKTTTKNNNNKELPELGFELLKRACKPLDHGEL